MKRRVRRFRVWLGLKILPANVLTLDVGPFIAGMQQTARAVGELRLEFNDQELEP